MFVYVNLHNQLTNVNNKRIISANPGPQPPEVQVTNRGKWAYSEAPPLEIMYQT